MPAFIIRVELHGADGADQEVLHREMQRRGFGRTVLSGGRTRYELPAATFRISRTALNAAAVRDLARDAAESTGKRFTIVAAEYVAAAWVLPPTGEADGPGTGGAGGLRADEAGGEPPGAAAATAASLFGGEVQAMGTSLHGLEVASARVEAALAAVAERLRGLEDRAGRVERWLDHALGARARSIGLWQFLLALAGSAAVLTGGVVALTWLSVHGFLPHAP